MEIIHIKHPHQLNTHCEPSSIAFGNFDGVHQGHQQVIRKAIDIAKQDGLRSGVLTFHPHPKEVLGKVERSTYLTPLPDKLKLIEELGVDVTFVIEFTTGFASLSPQEFIEQYILGLHIKQVITGFDFCFGYKGKGTTQDLQQWSLRHHDFNVHILSPVEQESEKVSSSRMRHLLKEGAVEDLFYLTHRYYQVVGRVVHGDKRGRTIGFPTANVQPLESYVLPKQGVYAVFVHWKGNRHAGVLNLGTKPTFQSEAPAPTIEVHLFDFDDDIYDEKLCISWVSFLRGEKKFNSVDELVHQINEDIIQAKNKLTLIN
jgi:riboflavin kinase/FMN adenylyltransferase